MNTTSTGQAAQPSARAAESHTVQNSTEGPQGAECGACSDRAGVAKGLPSWTGAANRHGLGWERGGRGLIVRTRTLGAQPKHGSGQH